MKQRKVFFHANGGDTSASGFIRTKGYVDISSFEKIKITTDKAYSNKSYPPVIFTSKAESNNVLFSDTSIALMKEYDTNGAKFVRAFTYGGTEINVYGFAGGLWNRVADVENKTTNFDKKLENIYEPCEYIKDNLVLSNIKDVLVNKTSYMGKTLDTTKDGNSLDVYIDDSSKICSAINEIEPNTTYTVFSVTQNERLLIFWRVAFYDDNYKFIRSSYDFKNFTTPDNAKYFIIDTYSPNSTHKSEAVSTFEDVYVINGKYTFEQIREVFSISNKLQNTKATTGYENKTWMCIGDSITEHNFRTMFNYHDFAHKELGINIINCGVSGSGYKVHDNDSESERIPPFYKRIQGYAEANYKPDVITIFGGINDLMFDNYEWGEITDTTSSTMYGCINKLVENIKQYFPNVPYGIISPLPTYACNQDGTCYADYRPSDKTNKEYIFVQKLEEYCDYYGIPFLNQYNKTGFRPWEEDFRTHYTKYAPHAKPDGVHPNTFGHALIYPKIREFIKTLI